MRKLMMAMFGAVLMFSATNAMAGALPAPQGKVLLSIEGHIANTSDGKVAQFDRAQLEALGMHTLKTTNPFIEGVHTFEGPLMSALLDLAGAEGKTVQARALDGYNVDIPMADLRDYPVILAMKMDGKVMRVRSKGPLWIIYPVDQFDALKAESFSGRSIWQLTTLTVK
ncbi:molybdopterin-dependent oxidoreductase [Pseudomonadota bacterium]